MTISFYLFTGIVLIALLLAVKFFGESNGLNKARNPLRWFFFAGICVLGVLSMSTVKRYMYPSDEEIFANSDYHLLEHRGFEIEGERFDLVKGQYPDYFAPEESLWDTKSGRITLTHDLIQINDYYEPFYLLESEDYFNLSNRSVDADVSEGFVIRENGRPVFRMEIIPYKEDGTEKCHYVIVGEDSRRDTSNFTTLIRKGYPLCDIIASTHGYVFTEELYQILQGTLLVRERIKVDNVRYGGEKNYPDLTGVDLVIMPGQSWAYDYTALTVSELNGSTEYKVDEKTEFLVPVYKEKYLLTKEPYTLFYSGIGRTKTDVYAFSTNADGKMELRYALPKMQHFSKEHERFFLTSSVNSVLDTPMDGGYYYNIFDMDENLYHINAEMRYQSGKSTETMPVQVMDMYSDSPSEKIDVLVNEANGYDEEFMLSTKSPAVKWIFGVKNLRETNPVNWEYIFRILFVFIFCIFIRIALDYYLQTSSLSYLEMSIYIVILCLATFRLILSWRVSTFVPIEDITGPLFGVMRNGTSGWTEFICVYPLALTVWSAWPDFVRWIRSFPILNTWLEKASNIMHRILAKFAGNFPEDSAAYFFFGPKVRTCVAFLCCLVVCMLLSRVSLLNRLCNIPAPLISYILFELFAITQENKRNTSYFAVRIFNTVVLTGYLFMADAGFVVIFMTYLVFLHLVVGPLTGGLSTLTNKRWIPYVVSLAAMVFLFFILRSEGEIMILLFNNIKWISLVTVALTACLIVWFAKYLATDVNYVSSSRTRRTTAYVVCGAAAAFMLLFIGKISGVVTDVVESKDHMKWRAEVQKLDSGETIDDLMLKSEFNSSDVTFIMRSAHNQWFINQYYKDGNREDDERFFQLQAHSNQGSPFPTQTTDLAITRYVTAEHGHYPPIWMLVLMLVLIATYCFEIKFSDEDGRQDRVFLGALVLMFTLAFLVYLSATNRIVFVGQDFPFMSIQSKVAVVFPITLMLLATLPIMTDRMQSERGADPTRVMNQKRWIPLFLVVFYGVTVWLIKPLGIQQDETQFDVSAIVQDISVKVDVIDRDLERFQRINDYVNKPKDELWEEFKANDQFSGSFKDALESVDPSMKFFASLLNYFDSELIDKDDPEELLHMRKRNGIWHLSVNKKHFFIPSKKAVSQMWSGDVFAAKVHREFMLSDVKGKTNTLLDSTKNYERNILPRNLRSQVPNIMIAKFDKSWTPSGEPLLLVTANQALASKQFYHIEAPEGTIEGSASKDQLATRVRPGDLLMLNVNDKAGQPKEVISWKYDMEADKYLAKNIWLNGRNRLFYPLGKEFIWSYQFANMVSSVYSKDAGHRDDSVRVSIDYDLHKKFGSLLSQSNQTRVKSLPSAVLEDILNFAQYPYSEMVDRNNRTDFYYVPSTHQVNYKKRVSSGVANVLTKINRAIEKSVTRDPDAATNALTVSEAVYAAVERQFEFTAVVVDGNGKIRLMFDHGKTRVVDPNNISHFNQFLSELYKAGDNSSERDVFGNRTLQTLPSGPGSSFKPILYTAITSNQKLDWESINVSNGPEAGAAKHVDPNPVDNNGNDTFDYYGGVKMEEYGEGPMSIDYGSGLEHNNYLVKSNNLYHSVITLLGMQRPGEQLDIMKPAGTGPEAFPIFTYKGVRRSFDPEKWFADGQIDVQHGILNRGLNSNFNLMEGLPMPSARYTNYFGAGEFKYLFENAGNYKGWVFAETGSLNVPDRALAPVIRNGFNQLFLGAFPLETSPLQMATMAMRLVTLNKAADITTLSDDPDHKPDYQFFDTYGWDSDSEYLAFHQRQVLNQMKRVPVSGTASGLSTRLETWRKQGYHVYAKTGTLNDGRPGQTRSSRIKHLMVIISNTDLETVRDPDKLKDVKYYVLYMSYIGIDENLFGGNGRFIPMIDAVIESELFKKYMEN